jgi:uncharacterized protein
MPSTPSPRLPIILVIVFVVLISARTIAGAVIDYQWWKEMGQVDTWFSLLAYGIAPVVIASLLAFAVFWIAHAHGVRAGGARLRDHSSYFRLTSLGLLVLAAIVSAATFDTWTVVRFFGSRQTPPDPGAWTDPVFSLPLKFHLFDVPFLRVLLGYVLAVALLAGLIHWAAARFWDMRYRFPAIQSGEDIDIAELLRVGDILKSQFLRGTAALVLLALAAQAFLGRYAMLNSDHGFLVGIDYVDENVRLPLQWVLIAALCIGAAAAIAARWRWLLVVPVAWIAANAVPAIVAAVYVRPNEIALERPYLERHIAATRSAYGLRQDVQEIEFASRLAARPLSTPAGLNRHKLLLDNIRLWDWRAFHDTVTQIQALRPYYAFPDSDVDRYVIDGQLRQVLLTPRELDIRQLPDAQASWINPRFVYTHGYGMVMAEANRITPDGLPLLFVQDAPAQIKSSSLKLTRPEIYYGELVREPVFVNSGQDEFSYPSGNDSVFNRYEGKGGFPISSLGLRLAETIRDADPNVLLTSLLTDDARMMIHRTVLDRLNTLAGFIQWDQDPYLVLTDDGRLVWTVDGYTSSDRHPYSSRLSAAGIGTVNYIRNAVKATVDAYNGDANIYIFDPADPVIQAYRGLFPSLFQPESAMPESLRKHARYPETYFRIQAEIYRTFHMRDPQAFYNKEDVWDVARNLYGQAGAPQQVAPVYVVATLPGETEPEFLLVLPFTPRNKDNLIGLMVARCDGEHLGEMLFLQLSKQALIFGPMQIEARINQDQVISKDLSLWNQQGSEVLRGQMLVLPVDDNFLYVEPIYIQAAEARMPQLKKVVLAMGDSLVYRDTYEEALAELAGAAPPAAPSLTSRPTDGVGQVDAAATPPKPSPQQDARMEEVRTRLRRYRELAADGKWAEAGRQLEELEALVNR